MMQCVFVRISEQRFSVHTVLLAIFVAGYPVVSSSRAWAQAPVAPPQPQEPTPQQQPAAQPAPLPPPPYPPSPYQQPLYRPVRSYGPPSYFPPGYQEHDGFFLRMLLGLGYMRANTVDLGTDIKNTGTAGVLSLALGGAVAPNLIVYGEFFGNVVDDFTVTINGISQTTRGTTLSLRGIGPGVAYYLPSNFYLSGSLALTRMSLDLGTGFPDDRFSTKWGLGFNSVFGQEWWISRDWGMGIACQFMMARMQDDIEIDPPTWTTFGLSLLFTATYN